MGKKKGAEKPPESVIPVPKPLKRDYTYEDAGSGKFVSPEYAAEHPGTTIKRALPVKPTNPPKKKT